MKKITAFVAALFAAATFTASAGSSSKTLVFGDMVLEPEDFLTFSLDEAPEEIDGREVLEEFLPDGISVEWTGKKFKAPKSASPKVKKDKDTGDYEIVVSEKGEDNQCSLKVSYKKGGRVSGSFKVYTVAEDKKGKPKLKSYSAKFSGTLGMELSVKIKKGGTLTATLD